MMIDAETSLLYLVINLVIIILGVSIFHMIEVITKYKNKPKLSLEENILKTIKFNTVKQNYILKIAIQFLKDKGLYNKLNKRMTHRLFKKKLIKKTK